MEAVVRVWVPLICSKLINEGIDADLTVHKEHFLFDVGSFSNEYEVAFGLRRRVDAAVGRQASYFKHNDSIGD